MATDFYKFQMCGNKFSTTTETHFSWRRPSFCVLFFCYYHFTPEISPSRDLSSPISFMDFHNHTIRVSLLIMLTWIIFLSTQECSYKVPFSPKARELWWTQLYAYALPSITSWSSSWYDEEEKIHCPNPTKYFPARIFLFFHPKRSARVDMSSYICAMHLMPLPAILCFKMYIARVHPSIIFPK